MMFAKYLGLVGMSLATLPVQAAGIKIDPPTLQRVAQIDPLYQSYNIEMVEVVGGRFWAPYPKEVPAARAGVLAGSLGAANGMFEKRKPIDLADRHLLTLAKGLGPAYVRVSGAWANSTFFQDNDLPQAAAPPKGFQSVLTRAQWSGVVRYAKATKSKLVITFPVSAGARNDDGSWNVDQARRLLRYTKKIGGDIQAVELINEPNVGQLVGLPKGYTAANFAADAQALTNLLREESPTTKTVGPGGTGEAGFTLFPKTPGAIATEALLSAAPPAHFDIFSYHFYGTVSKRCSAMDNSAGIKAESALKEEWLSRADIVHDHYKAIQQRFAPGAPIWVTEIAEAACGGDPWAATWTDTFRYVDQLGRLAKRGVSASFHNTLFASDYALVDDRTMLPRPSYWAAVLWHRIMGSRVLDAPQATGDVHVYAHCLPAGRGGIGLVAVNLSASSIGSIELTVPGQRFTLSAATLDSQSASLNGRILSLTADGQLPALSGEPAGVGAVDLAPHTITFLALPKANNPVCK